MCVPIHTSTWRLSPTCSRAGSCTATVWVPNRPSNRVDEDGNDLGGLRSAHLQVPIGTYTGWNLGRSGRFENGFCSLQGSFIPFARTKQERLDTGDRRQSIEERYPTKEAYAAAMRRATSSLVSQRLLLSPDAEQLMQQAESEGIRLAP
jgi:hypothetical protein